MNEKFYALPQEKQERIINAGFRVFSQNSYKKSPVNEIALEADISKSLLFFYFRNKKELYMFLFKYAEEVTSKALLESSAFKGDDIFDIMYRGLLVKAKLMKEYPDMSRFAIRAYYETDPDVYDDIQKIIKPYTQAKTYSILPPMDPDKFKDGLDLNLMYQDMYLASEGYLRRLEQEGTIDIEKVLDDYKKLIDFWKSIYLK